MKEFIRCVTLSILGQLGISCYIIADTFFISKGLGANGLAAHILSLLRGLVLIIPLAFVMSVIWEMNGIWLSFPAAEALTAIAGFFIYLKILKTFSL